MSGLNFLSDFAELSAFGATPAGGVDRQAATPEDGDTRRWWVQWLIAQGFEVRTDAIGNQFGLLTSIPGAPYLLVGSHLDSQPLAGRFDGAYGVLAASHAARTAADLLAAEGTTQQLNVAVVNWFNEEGCRFKPSMMGSSVHTGTLPVETALATRDPSGVTVAAALAEIGAAGHDAAPQIAAYAELHIEQGPTLEAAGTTIGVVTNTWCAYKFEVTVHGEQSHTGATPMAMRRDALLGAAHLVVAVNELTRTEEFLSLHTSVGEFTVLPNSPVVVAREVKLLMDLRAPATGLLDRALSQLHTRLSEIEKLTGVSIDMVRSSVWGNASFPAAGAELVRRVARDCSFSHQSVPTLAGHDATNLNAVVPTVLMFIPSIGGISHSEREFSTDSDLLAGLTVLTEVVRRLALDGPTLITDTGTSPADGVK